MGATCITIGRSCTPESCVYWPPTVLGANVFDRRQEIRGLAALALFGSPQHYQLGRSIIACQLVAILSPGKHLTVTQEVCVDASVRLALNFPLLLRAPA